MDEKNFNGIVEGLIEAAAFARGEDVLGLKVHVPAAIDTKPIRGKPGLTQAQFSKRYGFSTAAVRDREQGRRAPDTGIGAYLKVISNEPEAVERALELA